MEETEQLVKKVKRKPEVSVVVVVSNMPREAPRTGLTVVAGLDPTSRILTDKFEEAVGRFVKKSFSKVECMLDTALNIVPNDWSVIQSRLKERGII
jgi:hypothetical protein